MLEFENVSVRICDYGKYQYLINHWIEIESQDQFNFIIKKVMWNLVLHGTQKLVPFASIIFYNEVYLY